MKKVKIAIGWPGGGWNHVDLVLDQSTLDNLKYESDWLVYLEKIGHITSGMRKQISFVHVMEVSSSED